ncbi:MAG: VTT domain-containing protein [Lachnospiraceae bacterium]|nr:VTT domain-containing protein [Lachnospiraceae bacterium]
MKEQHTPRSAYYALLGVLGAILISVLLVYLIVRMYLPGFIEAVRTRDELVVEAYFDSLGHWQTYVIMWFFAYIQVISIVIPAALVHVVAGAVCGTTMGTLISYTAAVAAHMTVFAVATRATRLLRYISEERPTFGKLLNTLQFSENRTYYIAMALLTPGLPNWVIPYAAANSRMKWYTFLTALLMALPAPIYFTCLAADFLTQGDWMFSILSIGGLWLFVGLLFIGRQRIPDILKDLVFRVHKKINGR